MRAKIINCVILLISLGITIYLIEVSLKYYYKKIDKYPNLQLLIDYSKIGVRNHHIRTIDESLLKSGQQYYSVYKNILKENSNEIKKHPLIIFQGDSWAEILDQKSDILKTLMLKKTEIFINGGTSSYAPSLMEIQLRDIMNEINLKPSLIISYIDQTDFMDEVCDYAQKRIEKNEELIVVLKPTSLFYERYTANDVLARFTTDIPKILFFIETRLYNIMHKKMMVQNSGCTWKDIKKFLDGDISDKDLKKFKHSLKTYLETALTYSNKVILITHKHRRHFEGVYSNDIYKVLVEAVNELNFQNKVKIIDISPKKIANLDDVFPSYEEDPSSHPHNFYYENYIAEKIFYLVE